MIDTAAIDTQVNALVAQAHAFTVATHDDASRASAFLAAIKQLQRQVRDTFGPLKEAASAAHKKIVAEERRHLEPLDASEGALKQRLGVFLEAERRRREAEARAAREAQEREERARRAAEEAARKQAEKVRIEEALRRANDGESGAVERALATPLPPVVPPAAPAPVVRPPVAPRVEGVSTRETFRAQVTSVPTLAAHVASHPEHGSLLQPNMPELNRMAQRVRTAGAPIVPGVTCVADQSVVAR